MGPNLTRLFELSKSNMAGPEEWEAPFKLEQLFQAHGEALIAALEMAQPSVCSDLCSIGEHANECVKISTLLSQLESEAQP